MNKLTGRPKKKAKSKEGSIDSKGRNNEEIKRKQAQEIREEVSRNQSIKQIQTEKPITDQHAWLPSLATNLFQAKEVNVGFQTERASVVDSREQELLRKSRVKGVNFVKLNKDIIYSMLHPDREAYSLRSDLSSLPKSVRHNDSIAKRQR